MIYDYIINIIYYIIIIIQTINPTVNIGIIANNYALILNWLY